MGLVYDENPGRFSNGLAKLKLSSNSVKGKKDLARNRAAFNTSAHAANPKERQNNNSEWALQIFKLQSNINGNFQFGNNSGRKKGDQYPHSGVVQSQFPKSLEVGVASHFDKHSTVVEGSFSHAGAGGSKIAGMEPHPSNLEDPNFL